MVAIRDGLMAPADRRRLADFVPACGGVVPLTGKANPTKLGTSGSGTISCMRRRSRAPEEVIKMASIPMDLLLLVAP